MCGTQTSPRQSLSAVLFPGAGRRGCPGRGRRGWPSVPILSSVSSAEKLLLGDNFWNILPTEPGPKLIASQFHVACDCSLFPSGVAGVGRNCGLGFVSALDFIRWSPPFSSIPPLVAMFLFVIFFKKIFLCGLFNLATVQNWDAICVNKQTFLNCPCSPPGKGPSLSHLCFLQYPRPQCTRQVGK